MKKPSRNSLISAIVGVTVALTLAAYFTSAAVQGDFGLIRRIEVEAEATRLRTELAQLGLQVAMLENKTLRLSDDFLDLDLLDEQARRVLGYARVDEIIVR